MSDTTKTVLAALTTFSLGAAFAHLLNKRYSKPPSIQPNNPTTTTPRKLTVAYWKMRGLGAPLRMVCFYDGRVEGVDVEYKCFDAGKPTDPSYKEAWFGVKETLYLPQNPMMNLPWVKAESSSSSEMIVQTNACLTFLGRELGLQGANAVEQNRADQILAQTMDWRNASMRYFYGRSTPEEIDHYYTTGIRSHYTKINAFMNMNQTVYSAANNITIGDFHLFEMIDQHERFYTFIKKDSFLEEYKCLHTMYQNMLKEKRLQGYFDSEYYKFPMNNPHAFFLH